MFKENKEIQRTGLEIAVIGMAGRFPGARNIDEFWENLRNGVETMTFLTDEELDEIGIAPEIYNRPNFVRSRGILDDLEFFDSSFFGYTPKEAELMDPQMRLFYECAWTALEDAACDPDTYEGAIGVYAGGNTNLFWEGKAIFTGLQSDYFTVNHLCNIDFLGTRIAHKLNLKGPAITFQTACSTGIVAVDMACRELITGQADMALAGAVATPWGQKEGYVYEEGMVGSADGHCRSFDARATGTVFNDGAGVVVLKRLEEAIADRNTIYAVVLGTAVNNDGIRKNSYQAPSIHGQAEVIRAAHQVAGVDPETIGFVECHGTGTTLGDPIEVEALKMAFNTEKKGFCGLGSVKSNIGHVDTAAGIAGFIKTVLSLKHQLIPPSLHFETPNPGIDFENSPFYVNVEAKLWEEGNHPRRAGASSFGVGGTNAHAVLEEAPGIGSVEYPAPSPSKEHQLVIISARTSKALDRASTNLAEHLKMNPQVDLADMAYTLQVGRKAFKHRKMLIASTVEEVIALLDAAPGDEASQKVFQAVAREENQVIFMFSGQGSQYVNMGLDLYKTEPVFKMEMDRCFEILKPLLDYDIKEILYPEDSVSEVSRVSGSNRDDSAGLPAAGDSPLERGAPEGRGVFNINQTEIAQPVIFMIEYALAKLLIKLGIKPFAMVGHSIGEYVAACLAGVFSLEDALALVVLRGKLMQQMPPGSMLSVRLPEKELAPLLNLPLVLAAVNSSSLCVVSGPDGDIDSFAKQMEQKGHQCRKLHTSHAFHSTMMDPILKPFEDKVRSISLKEPRIPYISNVTGNWITVEQATDPGYWAAHIRKTVHFDRGLAELLKNENSIYVEVGPGKALSTFVSQHTLRKPGHKVVNLVRHPLEEQTDDYFLLEKIGQLWLQGETINWNTCYSQERRLRIPLPTYPFEKEVHTIASDLTDMIINQVGQRRGLQKNSDISQWFYTPSWKRSITPSVEDTKEEEEGPPIHWLVFVQLQEGIGNHLVRWLKEENQDVMVVLAGDGFRRQETDSYTINPGNPADYDALFNALDTDNFTPNRILHAWNITGDQQPQNTGSRWDMIDGNLDIGFYSLLYLAQAIGKHETGDEVQILVLTDNMQDVTGEETLYPHKAAILGPAMIIPQEFPNIRCCSIDIVVPPAGSHREKALLHALEVECAAAYKDPQIAWRGNHRLVRWLEPVPLPIPGETSPRLRPQGVYLVTGGLGGIGLVLAQHLAQQVGAHLALTARSPLPPKQEWQNWLDTHHESDKTSKRILSIREMEHAGAEVMAFSADVTRHQDMKAVIAAVKEHFGTINGVIHAAGVPGGGIILTKTREIARQVMAPKVKGTLVLNNLLEDTELDFFILCSSINAVVPTLGQVDYFSANAFLDAFASYKTSVDGTFTVSINWDAWQEVGMAVEAAYQQMGVTSMSHPLWEKYVVERPGQELYFTHLNLHRHWVLHDHMTANQVGLAPGTTYLEMVRAAFALLHHGEGMLEIHDAQFVKPLMVAENEEKAVALELQKQGKGEENFDFLLFSRTDSENDSSDNPINHVRGRILRTKARKPQTFDIKEIQSRCSLKQRIIEYEEGKMSGARGLLIFGPRWKSLKQVYYGEKEGLGFLELEETYTDELDFYKLHPALLDIATSFLYDYINPDSPYIPFSYKRLTMKKNLPAKFYSYSRLVEDNSSRKDFLKFNVTLMDETGEELVDIEEFTMLEVSKEIIGRIEQSIPGESLPAPAADAVEIETREPGRNIFNVIANPEDVIKDGILPREGIDAFNAILDSPLSQVVVSTTDLLLRIQQSLITPEEGRDEEEGVGEEDQAGYERPEISTVYAAPTDETEHMLARIWQNILGISQVGIHDDFFELGGDSLKAITLTSRIHKETNREVTLAEFFNRPTIRGMAKYITENAGEDQFYAIEPLEKKQYYPLSSAQKRFYFLQQMEPGMTAYNLTITQKMETQLDGEKLEQAFQKLISKHEILRTSFELIKGEAVQRIHERVDFSIRYFESSASGFGKAAANFIKPFDLAQTPLFRLAVGKIGEQQYILLLDMHHIITDGMSMGIFTNELIEFYGGGELSPQKLQYKDFCQWQTDMLASGKLKKQEEYWLKQFSGKLPVLNMPTDYPRPSIKSFAGDVIPFYFSEELTRKLNGLMKETGTTLYMMVLAIYNVLLRKYTRQSDIIVGSPIGGRANADLENIIGLLMETIATRNFPKGNKTFEQFLEEVKENTLKAFENQAYPFRELLKQVWDENDRSRNPLFDAMLIVQNFIAAADNPEAVELKDSPYEQGGRDIAVVDINLQVIERKNDISFFLEYCTKLFNRDSMEKLITSFQEIAAAVVNNKKIKLDDIEISFDLTKADSRIYEEVESEFKF